MTKSVFAIAALAAALSTAAFAADVKSTQPTPMTDAQMDAVTAGGAVVYDNGKIDMYVRLPNRAQAPFRSGSLGNGHAPCLSTIGC